MNNLLLLSPAHLLLLSPAHGDLGIVYVCDQDFFFIHEHDKEFDTFVDLLQYLQDLPERL